MQNRKKTFAHGKTKKSRDKPVVEKYMGNKRLIKYFFCGFGRMFLISMLFYKSFLICFFIAVVYGKINIGMDVKRNTELWKWNINLEFKEMMLSMSAALSAGYSIENSIRESKKDIELLYGDRSVLIPEIDRMLLSIESSCSVEKAISEFARECEIEDIVCFADIFGIAKKTGGNMVEIVRTTADRISGKIEVKREIKTMIAAKRMESRIMNVVPLMIIIYFWITSPGFLDCLYKAEGHIFMTMIFLLYLFGCMLSNKITEIAI